VRHRTARRAHKSELQHAQEVEKCEKLTNELSICHDTFSNHRIENAKLIAKVEKLIVYDDSLVNLKNDNASLIAKIDKLNESLSSLKIENDKLISKAKDLNVCNISISNLRNKNVILHAKIDELKSCKPSTSSVCNALNLGVEFFLLFIHQIRALLSFLFPFRSFFPISNQYNDGCPCHV
jgi:chromosome segregation ATPase